MAYLITLSLPFFGEQNCLTPPTDYRIAALSGTRNVWPTRPYTAPKITWLGPAKTTTWDCFNKSVAGKIQLDNCVWPVNDIINIHMTLGRKSFTTSFKQTTRHCFQPLAYIILEILNFLSWSYPYQDVFSNSRPGLRSQDASGFISVARASVLFL